VSLLLYTDTRERARHGCEQALRSRTCGKDQAFSQNPPTAVGPGHPHDHRPRPLYRPQEVVTAQAPGASRSPYLSTRQTPPHTLTRTLILLEEVNGVPLGVILSRVSRVLRGEQEAKHASRLPHIHPSVLQALPDRCPRGAWRGEPGALGPGLCKILQVNF
jgi:hypothetical protein